MDDKTLDVAVTEVTEVTPELVEAWQRLLRQLSQGAVPVTEEALRMMVDSDATTMFVAELDGRIVGSLSLATFRIPTGVRSWVEDVVVDEAARGHGIGQKLLEHAVEYARALGARTVDLTSRPSRESANRLYQRAGFKLRESTVYRYDFKND